MLTYETEDVPVEQALEAMLRVYSCIGDTILLSGTMMKHARTTKRSSFESGKDWFSEIYLATVLNMSLMGVSTDRNFPEVDTDENKLTILWSESPNGYVQLRSCGDHARVVISHHCGLTFGKWKRALQLTPLTTSVA